jgi:large subunit ribosomal protein L4
MPTLDVINIQKEKVGSAELPERLFGAPVKPSVIHEAVVMQEASMRQGTAATKTRGEVRGGGKKPWNQKGTGRARHGSIRSPIWRGGGVVFGPQPREYGYAIPAKKYRLALYGALTSKLLDGNLIVVDRLTPAEPKTRLLAQTLRSLGVESPAVILSTSDAVLERAARNLRGVCVMKPAGLNVYDLLKYRYLIIPQSEIETLSEAWK